MNFLTSRRRRTTVLLGGLVAVVLAIAGCGGGSSVYGGSGSGSAHSSAGSAASVKLVSTKLGKVLADAQGRTLYLFEADKGAMSACGGACANIWPPLTVGGGSKPVAGKGVSAKLLGTTTRPGGGRQVTYDGHPLYYYAADQHPGDTTGQGLDQFGAEWYVLAPKGTAIDS